MMSAKVANVVGLGLIGGSVALALQDRGWTVWGSDLDASRQEAALERGVIHEVGTNVEASISFVATPADESEQTVVALLQKTRGVVTDVGSVKSRLVAAVASPRFVGGHPMAGSELDGLDGADSSMFEGAIWVLTPGASSDDTFATVAGVVNTLGAEVVVLPADRHDDLVAVISHVPHLTAATLMGLADSRSEEHVALLKLAAGGFRDMTRIAGGRPEIWLDICSQNQTAIVRALSELIEGLTSMRDVVEQGDRSALLERLSRARRARMNLPSRVGPSTELTEVRIPIPDRPGGAAEVLTLAGELGVNAYDFEVVHSAEGDRGVIVLLIETAHAELFRGGLLARNFKPALQRLSS
jgi:prephenate dehydrogenase